MTGQLCTLSEERICDSCYPADRRNAPRTTLNQLSRIYCALVCRDAARLIRVLRLDPIAPSAHHGIKYSENSEHESSRRIVIASDMYLRY